MPAVEENRIIAVLYQYMNKSPQSLSPVLVGHNHRTAIDEPVKVGKDAKAG